LHDTVDTISVYYIIYVQNIRTIYYLFKSVLGVFMNAIYKLILPSNRIKKVRLFTYLKYKDKNLIEKIVGRYLNNSDYKIKLNLSNHNNISA